jgi:hypothetical protein
VPLLALPGPGGEQLSLASPAFYALVATLGVFVTMLFVLRAVHPNRKRGLEGYLEAAGVSLGFLVLSVSLAVALAVHDPRGNRTSFALFETVLNGYWLALAIPIVTVGSSVQARTCGAVRWVLPSIAVATLLFVAMFGYYYLS